MSRVNAFFYSNTEVLDIIVQYVDVNVKKWLSRVTSSHHSLAQACLLLQSVNSKVTQYFNVRSRDEMSTKGQTSVVIGIITSAVNLTLIH